MFTYWLVLPGLLFWIIVLLLPWRPWSTRETLDGISSTTDLSCITVLIPARNEEESIQLILTALSRQGNIGRILLIDDQSTDDTVKIAQDLNINKLTIIEGDNLPPGWSGKLWALEQGRRMVESEYILLLDADIELKSGTLNTLLNKAISEDIQLVSLMAALQMQNFWEKLLMPSFIYFFKLLYPFSLSNTSSKLVAAAAGGCILIRAQTLQGIGGFSALKNALIDDCTLARMVKNNGGKTWIGLTHSAVSHRQYPGLKSTWDMIARTAYTQLRYSILLLLLCTCLLFIAFMLPFFGIFHATDFTFVATTVTFFIIWGTYLPIVRYYLLNDLWTLTLPIAGVFYLLITWSSAIRHWKGKSAIWKDRVYGRKMNT